jgi:hypothetical protein
MCLREFDRRMQIEITRVKDHLEEVISKFQPIFGEETGEFIDFTKQGNGNTARLVSLRILDVKAPKLGETHPSSVHA